MSKKERESAHRRKRAADPNQQSKTGAAKPTYVSTDKPKKKKKMKEEFVSLPLQLEIPQNDGEFKLGLMFRESLEQDRGMLFIFESNDYWTFHMKNTFIPLDIAFIKEDGTIDSIKELDPMSPVPVYPESEIRYAVEVNRGWFAENDVEVGDALLEEEELNEVKDKKGKGSGTKDACYYKVKSRYSVWPSAYASGALVKCRKVGAANWGNSTKKEEYVPEQVALSPIEKHMSQKKRNMDKKPLKRNPKNEHYDWRDSYEVNENVGKVVGMGIKKLGKELGKKTIKDVPKALGKTTKKLPALKTTKKNAIDLYRGGDTAGMKITSKVQKKFDKVKKAIDTKKFDKVKKAIDTKVGPVGEYGGKSLKRTPKPTVKGGMDKIKSGVKDVKSGVSDVTKAGVRNTVSAVTSKQAKKAAKVTTAVGGAYALGRMDEKDAQKKKNKKFKDVGSSGVKPSMPVKKPDFPAIKGVVKKEHYDWRDAFDLDEQALNMAQRRAARGSSYKAPAPKPQPKPAAPAPQAKPASPAPQAKPAAPMAQAKPAAPAPKMGRTEVANRQKLGDQRVDALKAKNAKFQAAKKSGNLAQFRKDNPKMSGRERAQAMAKARIASKNAQSASPTPAKPTVDKVPPAAQAKPAPQAKPTANTVTKPAPQAKPQGGQGGTVTRTGADAASAAAKVGGTQNIPASQKVTPTSSTSGTGKGSIKFEKGALGKLVSGNKPTANTVTQPKGQDALNRRTTPQKPQDALNRNPGQKPVGTPAVNNNQSGGGVKKPVSSEMQRRLNRMNVGTNAAKEVQRVNPKPGQTVNVKQDPKTGSVSSTVTSKKTIGVDPSSGQSDTKSLVNNNKSQNVQNAKKVTNQMNQLNKREAEFEIPDYNDVNVPVVNSKGKTVKKIKGANAMPSGGSNKSVNANLDSF